jgi:prevent-host-death family protein
LLRKVGVHEAKTHLSEYLNRAAYRGERILVERHGKPVAALVSLEDLSRLEGSIVAEVEDDDSEASRQAAFRRAMEEAGAVTQWPSGDPVPLSEYRPLKIEGPPISDDIIRDRR